ncbi:type II toxin-antitoxin system prevent-host-death family antitoxin [Streptomyces sp. HUCO-GS316]|uniref:type II toxin-antitoxin system Phd/YefM family antitoxin n=1 Tax=Streptomyces sp. HUCO-GS316 TaxID=2692198 RepID=UPI00136E4BC7|nr:type II toxin-antitoxin system prevent-host-death family antitoxin [Streptomyces sp. HUCO-GS316]MXM66752.1 type II toxin-antitoxin system prevent-host-death family antitoxin [Streptomyces sp. HUCO-GS316]
MAEISSKDMGIRELRQNLSERLGAAVKGEITYVTSHGLRIAAIVPVADGEAIEASKKGTPAQESAAADS